MTTDAPFAECFVHIIDTGLKCPQCQGPIFHGKGKTEANTEISQIYSCSCSALAGGPYTFNKRCPLSVERWVDYNERKWKRPNAIPQKCHGIALPPADFVPPSRARRVVEVYDPEKHGKLLKSRVGRWQAACRDAKDALEELMAIQEEFADWQSNLPENFADSPLAEKLQAMVDLDLSEALAAVEEADCADLPLGFGRD